MSVNVDKLKDGLSNYNDSLKSHLGQLQTDFTLLQNSYRQFAYIYHGTRADEIKIVWLKNNQWFEDYLINTRKISDILDERINFLNNIASVHNSITWTKAAQLRPNKKAIFKEDTNSLLNEKLKPNHTYKIDGYEYKTDSQCRVSNVSGSLILKPRGRNKGIQVEAKKEKNALELDQGGHLIAQIFFGLAEKINIVPMHKKLNTGGWLHLERKWKKELEKHSKVTVSIRIIYVGNEKRPIGFEVLYTINDKEYVERLFNWKWKD